MLQDDDPPVREFADRGTIWLLGSTSMMQAFVRLASDVIAERLDFSRSERVNRSFIADDLQKREADIVFRVPYRDDTGEILIYILVEHQSERDPTMPWRVLHRMDLLWGQQCRAFQDADLSKSHWRLSAILPIVFYTGETTWKTSGSIREIVDAPEELLKFVPQYDILFLGLHEIEEASLENSDSTLGWLLRAFQAVRGSLDELARVVKRVVTYLEMLPEEMQGEWARAMHFLLLLIRHNRPHEERDELYDVVFNGARRHREDVEEIVMTDAQWLLDEGWKEGWQKGQLEGHREGHREGEQEGAAREARRILLRLGSRRYGPPDENIQSAIESMTSVEQMEELVERLYQVNDWNALLAS